MSALYFGCWREAGHYLFDTRGFTVKAGPGCTIPGISAPRCLDTEFCPGPRSKHTGALDPAHQVEGRAALHHVEGRTVLAFWDRSVDPRPGSHSTFVLDGALTFEAAVAAARMAFPGVWARYRFEVRPWESPC